MLSSEESATQSFRDSGVIIVAFYLTGSIAKLTDALRGVDVVNACLPSGDTAQQITLVDATGVPKVT